MAMEVEVSLLTGAAPTITAVTSKKFNREDTQSGTTPIPTPTALGTNFSFIATFQINIVTVNGLSMSDVKFGKVTTESVTGTKLWHTTAHAVGAYVQATAAPTATGDNNVTAPTLNGAAATAVPLISVASVYSAGPHNTTGRKGPLVEVALGIDFTNLTAGSAVALPDLRFSWTES